VLDIKLNVGEWCLNIKLFLPTVAFWHFGTLPLPQRENDFCSTLIFVSLWIGKQLDFLEQRSPG
jgi:hypothetical protein